MKQLTLSCLIAEEWWGREGRIKCTRGKTATDLNRQVEDVCAVLKIFFSTQRNSFSVNHFLTLNLLLHSQSWLTQLQAYKLCWNYQKRWRSFRKTKILPSQFSRHLQGYFSSVNSLWNMLLIVLTQCLSYWLYFSLFD